MLAALPEEIKSAYLIASLFLLSIAIVFVAILVVYNKKQRLFNIEKQLKEAALENQILQAELEKSAALQKERERISSDMHDDLGSGLSTIKLQAEFLKYKITEHELAKELDEIIKQTSEITATMKDMVWTLNSMNDTLDNFVYYVKRYATQLAEKSGMKLQCDIQLHDSDLTLQGELRRQLLLCVKEALNNAIRHSKASELKLFFTQHENILKIFFSDNGVGIQAKSLHGNGLKFMKQRADKIAANLSIESQPGLTQINIVCPL